MTALAVEPEIWDLGVKPRCPRAFCRSCGCDFNGDRMFDRHRVGTFEHDWSPDHEDGRRCLGADEMQARGWRLNEHGRWYDPAGAEKRMETLAASRARSRVETSLSEG